MMMIIISPRQDMQVNYLPMISRVGSSTFIVEWDVDIYVLKFQHRLYLFRTKR